MNKMRPLAHRMRPSTLEEVYGQTHLVGEGKPIRKMVENKQVSSMILFGPPGIGKTTIAQAVAGSAGLPFRSLNAVSCSKKDLTDVIKEAEALDTSLLLYISEIHRLSRGTIEVLLPVIEDGSLVVIGSTTESVFHSIPAAIRSRCTLFKLESLSVEEICSAMKKAIKDKDKGLGKYDITYENEVLTFLAERTGGDMRSALNTLENVVITNLVDGKANLTIPMVEELVGQKHVAHNGESSTYNLLSAFHKSIRGSDVDAALYYLALLMEAGEFINLHRRMLAIADEDIGLAGNPNISTQVYTSVAISEKLGYPECKYALAKAVILLCLNSKSNSVGIAINSAIDCVKEGKTFEPPKHLRDNHFKGAATLGHIGYKYPHDYPVSRLGGWVEQQYLPDELVNTQFYQPKENGHEKAYAEMYQMIQQAKKKK